MKKIILFAGLSLATVSGMRPGDVMVMAAADAFYNFETRRAITILDSARIKYPDNPLAHFTWVAAHMLHSEANSSTEDVYFILNKNLDEIIPILKTLQKKYPRDPIYNLYLGCAIGLRARVSLGKKQWLSTLFNAYKGFRMIQRVARNNPEIIDAQLPVGMVEYYSSLNSDFIKWGVRFMGIDANRKAGLTKIKKAALHGEFSSNEAKFIFSFLTLWMEGDPRNALSYSQELRKRFPHNYHYGIMFVECLILMGKDKEAQEMLATLKEELVFLTPIQQDWYRSYYLYELALFQFYSGNIDEALIIVDEAINIYHAELDIVLSNLWLLKGMIHDKKGNRDKAKKAYNICRGLNNHSAAMKKSERFYKIQYK